MIAIETEKGELVKVLKNFMHGDFGIHEQFGLISKDRAQERVLARKRQGYDFTRDRWICSFHLKEDKNSFSVGKLQYCSVREIVDGQLLETPNGNFKLVRGGADYINSILIDREDKRGWMNRGIEIIFLAIFLLIPILYFLNYTPIEEKTEENDVEPITVTIVKPAKTVNIQRDINPDIKVKPLTKVQRSKRAVKRNLGFLGMVGSKNMKDAVGGVPQKLQKSTAGAGPGGDAGSGGEVLTGLGKGLKKTTVGNTGVKGLGGKLVTKGTAGGGKGGYGNTMVASGSGAGISAIAVSNSGITLEGGIGRYAINATIAKYLSQVRRCYENQLKLKPNLQGLVEMSFEIGPRGLLNFARVSRTTLNDKATENCISKKMLAWQFPKPKGGVKVPVKYPFMLRPVGL